MSFFRTDIIMQGLDLTLRFGIMLVIGNVKILEPTGITIWLVSPTHTDTYTRTYTHTHRWVGSICLCSLEFDVFEIIIALEVAKTFNICMQKNKTTLVSVVVREKIECFHWKKTWKDSAKSVREVENVDTATNWKARIFYRKCEIHILDSWTPKSFVLLSNSNSNLRFRTWGLLRCCHKLLQIVLSLKS